jgi:dihydroorotate dehydrogenase
VVLVGFAASGASGMPGAGSFGLPLVVPIAPALVGQRLTAQALGLDAGTADGFTLTNAVEVWLR